jgi:hypothetical protein
MLRITTQTAGSELLVKLEGCLAGPWVQELDTCWREMAGPRSRVRLDLREVCHVDSAGRELIAVMFRAGVRFIARGCDLPELLKEIALAEAGK